MPTTIQRTARRHKQGLEISSYLSQYWRRSKRPMAHAVTPEAVIQVLNSVGIRPVLMGTYGLVDWRGEPRATLDVDVLVRMKEVRKAVRNLKKAFPNLVVIDGLVVTRFKDPALKKVVIDVMKPTQSVYKLVFRNIISVGSTHDIPDLEMALISKFAAMTSHHRVADRKMQDGVDFVKIVKHNRKKIDMPKLLRLADKVYPKGSEEIIDLIRAIDAGRTIQV